MSAATRSTLQCRNCGAAAPERYCPRCGQATSEHLPSAREFLHEFVLHYFAAEGRLWRTLGALILHPGRLTLEYLRGRRLAYVLPLRLYLTVSVVFFLALRISVAPSTAHLHEAFHRSLTDGHSHFTILGIPGLGEAVRNPDGSLSCTLPGWLCARVRERVLQPPEELERRVSGLPTELFSHLSTAVFVLLPVFAFYLQLVYPRRTYGEHFLFALHLHAFAFLALLLTLLPLPGWLEGVVQASILVYALVALRAVYQAPWWQTVLKGAAVGIAYVVTLGAATLLIAGWALVA
jgi:uncharacterized protein DUF3667